MGLPETKEATASRDSRVYTAPVGLLGELRRIARVFSVMQAQSRSFVSWKPSSRVGMLTITAPAAVRMERYRG